jgi:hypothetical protein
VQLEREEWREEGRKKEFDCLLFIVPESFVWYVTMILKAEPLLVDGALSLRRKVLEVFFLKMLVLYF